MSPPPRRSPSSARRRLLAAAALPALGGFAPRVMAQPARGFPTRPVRVIVPFTPGGALDTVARMVGQRLAEKLEQPVLIENRPGAANVIGNDLVAKAAPDGHTLLFAAAPLALNTALGMKLPYQPLADFAPISLVASIPVLIMAHPGTPYRNLADLVAAARSAPVNYASPGVGSMPHLIGEALRSRAGLQFPHIGYKGAAPALQDALAGTVPVLIDAYIPSGAQIPAGKLRGLAVAAERRSAVLPDLPTTVEQGFPELVGSGFYGLLAPARTPPAIIEALHAAVVASVNGTDVRERLVRQGYEVHASTPAEYAAYLRREIDRWTPVVRAAGIKPE
jgi:tripartite-type tricarboxylate transporter receptor subunit TctC